MEAAKLKVADLKKELKARGLSTVGNKQELIERLQGSLDNSVDEEGNVDECILVDEDEDAVLEETLDEVLETPSEDGGSPEKTPKGSKRSASDDDSKSAPKKIVLNRNTLPVAEKENVDIKDGEDGSLADDAAKKSIKITSGISEKERLELRAKKFGLPVATDSAAKAEARAARFGLSKDSPASSTKITAVVAPSLEVLQKRAQRFGASVSSVMEKAELDERIRKRQERFGIVEVPVTTKPRLGASAMKFTALKVKAPGATVITDPALDEKKRLRAERFKIK